MRRVRLVLAVLVFALLAMGQDDCSTETKNEPDKQQAGGGGGGGEQQTAQLGDAITLKGTETEMRVRAVRVLDPLPHGQFDTPTTRGARFVGIEIELENVGSKTYSDSPGNGAYIITSRDEQANSTIVSSGPCSGGISAQATIAPGSKRRGCIPFEVPKGQRPATFQFTLDSGFGPESGEWKLR